MSIATLEQQRNLHKDVFCTKALLNGINRQAYNSVKLWRAVKLTQKTIDILCW